MSNSIKSFNLGNMVEIKSIKFHLISSLRACCKAGVAISKMFSVLRRDCHVATLLAMTKIIFLIKKFFKIYKSHDL